MLGASDPDSGDIVSFVNAVAATAQGGSAVTNTFAGALSIQYTPPLDFVGTDYLYYTITDGKAISTGTVQVTVRDPNAVTFNMLPLVISNNLPFVRFAGSPNTTYQLQRSGDMANWNFSVPVTTGTNGIGAYYDTGAPNTNGYYRTRYP